LDFYVAKGNNSPGLGSVYANGYKSPSSAGAASIGGNSDTDLGDGWTRRTRIITITTAGNTWLRFGCNTSGNETEIYIDNVQVELKSHATPFVDGTRSSTQSLIDLKRTTDIDLSNTSFDSTGQPTFDGTDDYIDATVNSITDETSLTISYWFKMNWTSGWSPFITLMDSNGTQKFHTWFGNDRGIDFQTSINSVKPMFVASSTNYPNNEYINVVMVINGSGTNNVKCYVNAIYKAQGSLSFNTHDIDKLRIGRDPGNAYGGGHMPRLAIYNVPLTEPEISQNFNAYKNRFNL
jgi:hypothetical protein